MSHKIHVVCSVPCIIIVTQRKIKDMEVHRINIKISWGFHIFIIGMAMLESHTEFMCLSLHYYKEVAMSSLFIFFYQ